MSVRFYDVEASKETAQVQGAQFFVYHYPRGTDLRHTRDYFLLAADPFANQYDEDSENPDYLSEQKKKYDKHARQGGYPTLRRCGIDFSALRGQSEPLKIDMAGN